MENLILNQKIRIEMILAKSNATLCHWSELLEVLWPLDSQLLHSNYFFLEQDQGQDRFEIVTAGSLLLLGSLL